MPEPSRYPVAICDECQRPTYEVEAIGKRDLLRREGSAERCGGTFRMVGS